MKKIGIAIGIISVIIVVVIIFSFVGTSSSNLITGANSITDANNCSEDTYSDSTGVELTYNITDKYCYNSTGSALYVAGQYDLPLNSLFSSSGVLLIMLMASILILIIGITIKFGKKQ